MLRLFLAARYLWRRPIMWVSVVGISLGIGSLVVVDSLFKGYLLEYVRVVQGISADLVIAPPPTLHYAELRRELLATEGVQGAARRLLLPCLYPTEKSLPATLGIGQVSRGPILLLQGIEPDEERSVTTFDRFLTTPPADRRVADVARPFALPPGTPPGVMPILVGQRLAEALDLGPGSSMELLTWPTQPETGKPLRPATVAALVVGAFETQDVMVDLATAFVPLAHLQTLTEDDRRAHDVAVRAVPGTSLNTLASRLRLRLNPLGVPRDAIRTWKDDKSRWVAAVENQRQILNVILFFIVFVAGFNLLVTLNMTVSQKVRDIGILSSMGASSWSVASIFTACGLLVWAVGAALGLGMGWFLADHVNEAHDLFARLTGTHLWKVEVYGFATIPVSIDGLRVGFYLLATLVTTVGFALLASWRVGRMDPIRALRKR